MRAQNQRRQLRCQHQRRRAVVSVSGRRLRRRRQSQKCNRQHQRQHRRLSHIDANSDSVMCRRATAVKSKSTIPASALCTARSIIYISLRFDKDTSSCRRMLLYATRASNSVRVFNSASIVDNSASQQQRQGCEPWRPRLPLSCLLICGTARASTPSFKCQAT